MGSHTSQNHCSCRTSHRSSPVTPYCCHSSHEMVLNGRQMGQVTLWAAKYLNTQILFARQIGDQFLFGSIFYLSARFNLQILTACKNGG